jgi:hypothetical protein
MGVISFGIEFEMQVGNRCIETLAIFHRLEAQTLRHGIRRPVICSGTLPCFFECSQPFRDQIRCALKGQFKDILDRVSFRKHR